MSGQRFPVIRLMFGMLNN